MIIICGKSQSGKSTVIKELRNLGVGTVVPYTTRPMRGDEEDGVEYHFVTDDKFRELQRNSFFACVSQFTMLEYGTVFYGSAAEDLKGNKAAILNPYEIKQVTRLKQLCPVVFQLLVSDATITKRAKIRVDDPAEAARRLIADKEDFAGIDKYVDVSFRNDLGMEPQQMASMILDTYNRIIKIK